MRLYSLPVTRLGLLMLGLLGLVSVLFWPALSGGFIFDDYPIFAENPAIHISGWQWHEWRQVWSWSHTNIQRPFAMLTFALNYALGNEWFGFKLTNLLIHLLNTVLVLLLTRRLLLASWLTHETVDSVRQERRIGYWALAIAFAWAIHPLQVSTVMYVVQRMEMLGFTFALLALLAYWRARQEQLAGRRAWPWLLMFAVLIGAGYYAKETAVLVPGYAMLIELTLLRFEAAKAGIARAWKIFYIAGCAAAISALLFYVIPHFSQPANFAGRGFTVWERELTQLRVLPMYLYWYIMPLPSHLSFYYDSYPISTDLLHPATTLLGGSLLLGLLGLAIAVHQRRPLLALGIGWFFVSQALTSSPVPLELVFEHRNYPALLGISLAYADLFFVAANRFDPRVAVLVASVVLMNFGLLTFIRSSIWGDRLFLTQTLSEDNPSSARAAYDLARRYMFMAHNDPNSPLYSLSVKELRRASTLPSASPMAEEALILINADHHDQPDVPALWKSFFEKLENRPLGPEAYMALDKLTMERLGGKADIDARQLAHAYEITIKRNPSRANLHAAYAELADTVLHEPDLAIVHWQEALKLDKDVAGYSKQLAGYLLENHRNQEARAVIDQAWQLQPILRNDAALISMNEQAEKNAAASE